MECLVAEGASVHQFCFTVQVLVARSDAGQEALLRRASPHPPPGGQQGAGERRRMRRRRRRMRRRRGTI